MSPSKGGLAMNSLNLAAGGSREGWRGVGVREGERRRGTETRRGDKCGGRCRRLAGRAGWAEGPQEEGKRGPLLHPHLSAALSAAGKPFFSLLL